MKRLHLILALIMPMILKAEITRENISISDFDVTFSGVEQVDSLSAKDLYNATLVWLANEYQNPQDFIKDNTTSAITLNGRLGAEIAGDKCINCTLVIYFKDGRYKWEISDCIYLEDSLGLIMGRRDKPIMALPRYQRAARFDYLIKDFSPLVDSFRKAITKYQPGITAVPSNLSADW